MKRYLGSRITAFAAIIMPCFIIGPLIFAAVIITSEISPATIFLTLLMCSCTLVWGIYMKQTANHLYTWGNFGTDGIAVKTLFSNGYFIPYQNCRSVGIGLYFHRVQNSVIGSMVYFIYFSTDYFDEKYRTKINLWKPTHIQLKVEFSEDLYYYLLAVLPQKQRSALQHDYEQYMMPIKN